MCIVHWSHRPSLIFLVFWGDWTLNTEYWIQNGNKRHYFSLGSRQKREITFSYYRKLGLGSGTRKRALNFKFILEYRIIHSYSILYNIKPMPGNWEILVRQKYTKIPSKCFFSQWVVRIYWQKWKWHLIPFCQKIEKYILRSHHFCGSSLRSPILYLHPSDNWEIGNWNWLKSWFPTKDYRLSCT